MIEKSIHKSELVDEVYRTSVAVKRVIPHQVFTFVMKFLALYLALIPLVENLDTSVQSFTARLHCLSFKGKLYLFFGNVDIWMVEQNISSVSLEYRRQKAMDSNRTVKTADTIWYNGNFIWKVGDIYNEYPDVLYFRLKGLTSRNSSLNASMRTIQQFQYVHAANQTIEDTWQKAWLFRNQKNCFKHHNTRTMIKGYCSTLEILWADNDYSSLVDPILEPKLQIADHYPFNLCENHQKCQCKNNVCYYKQEGLLKPNKVIQVCLIARQRTCTVVYTYCKEREDHISWFIILIIVLSTTSTIFGTVVLLMCNRIQSNNGGNRENRKRHTKKPNEQTTTEENETELL